MLAALQLVDTVLDEADRYLDQKRKPVQQKAIELKWSRDHSPYKTLADPDPKTPKDLSTARGYLLDKHGSDRWNSETTLRAALTKYSIPIQNIKAEMDVRTGEKIDLGDTVLESDLDLLVEKIKAAETAQRQARRRRTKDS